MRHYRRLLLMVAVVGSVAHAQDKVKGPGARYYSTKDDAEFMQGMVMHHAQAITMANQAVSHGASKPVQIFCARIALSQGKEIRMMQNWLRDRKFAVPDSTGKMPAGAPMIGGMTHGADGTMSMPGMLSADQMKLLTDARGPSWDRLFLTFMIQHHEGALLMVDKLFKSAGGGQDDDINKFANGVQADQETEIARMKQMLDEARAQRDDR